MRFEANSKKGIINVIGELSNKIILKLQYIDFTMGR